MLKLKDAKKTIVQIKNNDLEKVFLAIKLLENLKDFSLIKKIVVDKNLRPESLDDQLEVLLLIYGLNDLELNYRLFALIAAGHKSMESKNLSKSNQVIKLLEDSILLVETVGLSDNIRSDRLHLFFSTYSVLFHLYLFTLDTDNFFRIGTLAVNKFSEFPHENYRKGFYQTSGNIIRCYLVYYLSSFIRKDSAEMTKCVEDIKEILYEALLISDDNKVKFSEYLGYTKMYYILNEFHKQAMSYLLSRTEKKPSANTLLASCFRGHGEGKVELLLANFNKNYDSWI